MLANVLPRPMVRCLLMLLPPGRIRIAHRAMDRWPGLAFWCVLVAALLAAAPLTQIASADIYQWEWIDHSDPSLGRQESATLVPDGAGRDAVPGASLSSLDLTTAWLYSADLRFSNFGDSILIDAELSQSNLTDAYFRNATLTGADFTGAEVCRADYRSTTDSGFTAAQLYSTASYQAGDLTGIGLRENDLTGWNFAGMNLAGASFEGDFFNSVTKLHDVDFSHANLTDVSFIGTNFRNHSALTAINRLVPQPSVARWPSVLWPS